MKVDLNKADCQNVKACILVATKQPNIDEQAMMTLLSLSQKFNWKEEVKKETKKNE